MQSTQVFIVFAQNISCRLLFELNCEEKKKQNGPKPKAKVYRPKNFVVSRCPGEKLYPTVK